MNDDFDKWLVRQDRISWWLKWATVVMLLLLIGLLAAPVLAHSWYPWSCCSDKDCFRTGPDNVIATQGGWRIESSGEIIPYDDARVKPTPPEGGNDFHVCHLGGDPKARALCLFVPEFGA